jgi:hypothetical protein
MEGVSAVDCFHVVMQYERTRAMETTSVPAALSELQKRLTELPDQENRRFVREKLTELKDNGVLERGDTHRVVILYRSLNDR